MAFKQSTVVSGEYTQYDATQNKWVSYSLRTNATDIVINSANRLFVQNGTHAVNGKKFYTESNGTYTAQAITLYGSDITLSSSDNTNIATSISGINSSITALNTFKNTTVPNTYLNKTNGGIIAGDLTVNGTTTLKSTYVTGLLGIVGSIRFNGEDDLSISSGRLTYGEKPLAYTSDLPGNVSSTSAGLMSSTDKSRLDSMWSIWSADDTSDTLVNKIQEVLSVFENMPESSNLVTLLAGKQNKVSALGSTTEPVYVSADGTFSKASKYAGGTAVTLNGSSKAGTTASFYAPTSAGTTGYILSSNGTGAPTWINGADSFLPKSGGIVTGATTFSSVLNVPGTTGIRFDGADDLHLTTNGRLVYGSGGIGNILAYSSEVPVITVSATAPTNPKTGDIWINTAS